MCLCAKIAFTYCEQYIPEDLCGRILPLDVTFDNIPPPEKYISISVCSSNCSKLHARENIMSD